MKSCCVERPQASVGYGGEDERTSAAHALLEMLDIEAERSSYKDAGGLETTDYVMELGAAPAKAIRKLHGPKQESASAYDAVRQEIPAEGMVVRPNRIF